MGIVVGRHQGPPMDEDEIIALMYAEGRAGRYIHAQRKADRWN